MLFERKSKVYLTLLASDRDLTGIFSEQIPVISSFFYFWYEEWEGEAAMNVRNNIH